LAAANEIFEKVATFGLTANMVLYLTERYLMSSAFAAVVIYNWHAVSNFLPIFGAVLADACIGRFWTIAAASVVYQLVRAPLFFSRQQLINPLELNYADDGGLATGGTRAWRC